MDELRSGQIWKGKTTETRIFIISVNVEKELVLVQITSEVVPNLLTFKLLNEGFAPEEGWNSKIYG